MSDIKGSEMRVFATGLIFAALFSFIMNVGVIIGIAITLFILSFGCEN